MQHIGWHPLLHLQAIRDLAGEEEEEEKRFVCPSRHVTQYYTWRRYTRNLTYLEAAVLDLALL